MPERSAPATQGLTESQYQTLQNDILVTNQAEFATAVAAADYQFISDAYNQLAAPVVWCWRTSVSEKELYEATSPDNTTWSWPALISQTVQERDAWSMMMHPGAINPSLPQTRDAFSRIFGGTGALPQGPRTFLLSLSRRQVLRGEALFADRTAGDGSTATPATLVYQGQVTYHDVFYALTGNRP